MTVEIERVRVERLHAVPECDLDDEGGLWRDFAAPDLRPIEAFGRWWNSVHSRPGTLWEDDPWVWVVTFRPIEGP